VTVAVAVTVGGCAVTVTVLVSVEAVGVASSPLEPMLPSNPIRTSPPTMLPTMIKTRLLNGGRGAPPVGSGYQPGVGDGCVVKDSPGIRVATLSGKKSSLWPSTEITARHTHSLADRQIHDVGRTRGQPIQPDLVGSHAA
jgi:hypothetical protein